MPEEHDVLPQLLNRPLPLHIGIRIKAVDEGVYNVQLVQGLCMGLQCLVAASHRLGTLQPAQWGLSLRTLSPRCNMQSSMSRRAQEEGFKLVTWQKVSSFCQVASAVHVSRTWQKDWTPMKSTYNDRPKMAQNGHPGQDDAVGQVHVGGLPASIEGIVANDDAGQICA